jgi:hypothetical protein
MGPRFPVENHETLVTRPGKLCRVRLSGGCGAEFDLVLTGTMKDDRSFRAIGRQTPTLYVRFKTHPVVPAVALVAPSPCPNSKHPL